jgi:hypothetical protein
MVTTWPGRFCALMDLPMSARALIHATSAFGLMEMAPVSRRAILLLRAYSSAVLDKVKTTPLEIGVPGR